MVLIVFPYSILTKFVSCSTFTKQRSWRAMCSPDHPQKLQKQIPIRRSANYKPSIWGVNQMQSLYNPYAGEIYVKRADELKEVVKKMLEEDKKDAMDLLKLIDDLQRLGLAYHFESQIKQVLISIYKEYSSILDQLTQDDLLAKALIFRLFRQHGFNVSPEIFDCFKDENSVYKTSLCKDTKGMIYLYEASYLSVEGESTLELAREFSKKHLTKSVEDEKIDHNLSALVHHALQLPLHWRSIRLEARWFIDIYERRVDMNHLVLQLAKLDFNILQSIYQEELKDASRWWNNTGFPEKLTYVRDCLVPCYFWVVEAIREPQYAYARRICTEMNMLIVVVDDTYDVYGTLDELQLFTDAIERWDICAMDQLPDYMKLCYLGLYNFVNEMGYDALRDHGIQAIPYLKKMWTDLGKAYLVEAKWYSSGYKPTLDEYISNAMVSVTLPVILLHLYLQMDYSIKRETLEAICNYQDIVRWSALISRLADDLGTCLDELKRGDVPKSVQCYMIETGASEEQAREYMRLLISETWKKMNKDQVANSPFSETFIKMAMNFDRMSQCVYEFGDGLGNVNSETRDRISTTLFKPIPVGYK